MNVINFFGGPSCGKSTIAAYVFSQLKIKNYSCEYVNEYAKDCVYEGRNTVLLNDQLYVLAKQNHKLKMLQLGKQIDFAIVDSPLLLSNVYGKINNSVPNSFYNLTLDYFKSYNNINFFVQRKHNFQDKNRIHNEQQSIKIDDYIKDYLVENNILFEDLNTSKDVISQLKESIQLRQLLIN